MPKFHACSFFAWCLVMLVLSQLFLSGPVLAQGQVNYNYLISDHDLTDYQSMTLEQIQAFLVAKGSSLATYLEPITRLRAAQIIYQSAQDFGINPKFLLALIQKEQSLIEDGTPLPRQYDWATGYAVCDSCSTDDPALQKFKGFYNQVYHAAKRLRTNYLVELETLAQTSSGFGPGLTKIVDGLAVTPANKATAALYTYTPHLHGNELMALIWQRYFARAYSDGTLLKTEGNEEVWLIENGLRRQFANQSVYLSRYEDFVRVVTVSQTDLEKYPQGQEIKFANYSYLRIPSGTVYLVVGDSIRGFASAAALRRIGVNPEEIVAVAAADLTGYTETEPITTDSVYPLGALLQTKATGGVYWVQDGVKYPLWSAEIMKVNFPGRQLAPASPAELEKFTTGSPVLFREGELVKSTDEPVVYLISNSKRRPFVSAEAFEGLGFAWGKIIVTSPAALALHPLGEPILASF